MSPRIARAARIATAVLLAAIVAVIAARLGTPREHSVAVLGQQLVGSGTSVTAAGQDKDNGKDKRNFTISGTVSDLYPGAQKPLVLTVANPNNFAIDVQTLAATVQAPSSSGCPPTMLTIPGFSGHLPVPANATATKTMVATMDADAPNACQDVTFPLKYSGTAVKP
jgi:hypothetical protein